jgi:hypothetical protein
MPLLHREHLPPIRGAWRRKLTTQTGIELLQGGYMTPLGVLRRATSELGGERLLGWDSSCVRSAVGSATNAMDSNSNR